MLLRLTRPHLQLPQLVLILSSLTIASNAQNKINWAQIKTVVTNPIFGADPNDRRMVDFTVTTDSSTSNPNFSDENVIQIIENASNGQALYGNGSHAKKTFIPLDLVGNMQGSGQKLLLGETLNCYSMSDCFAAVQHVHYAGGPINGDEGQAFQDVSELQQQANLNLSTVSSVAQTTCNTTTTQSLTAAQAAQTFTVASMTGCNVNDWVVLGQEQATAGPSESLMKITSVGAGTLSGQVVGNYPNGTTVTPATVLTTAGDAFVWGQDRVVVNLTATPYTTGTVASIAGGGFIGSGTGWTTGMVGGNSTIIGCVSLTNDDYTGAPFNGSGEQSTLKSWYQILATGLTTTDIGIMSTSVAGDASYHGNGVGAGAYTIRPCAKALRVSADNRQIILETNSFTWNTSDSIEEAVSPYPDVTGFQYHLSQWTPGGTHRGFLYVINTGARMFQQAINIAPTMAVGGGADTIAWQTGIAIAGAQTGLAISNPTSTAIRIGATGSQTSPISWDAGTPYLQVNSGTHNLELQTISGGSAGFGDYIFTASDPVTGLSIPRAKFGGMLDAINFNNSVESRFGIFGISANTWFVRTRISTDRLLEFFNNNNGGGEGTGSGAILTLDGSTGHAQIAGGSANKAVCFKADGKTLGFCSTQPDSTGACTCN